MDTSNIILQLPFDESNGSSKAYDYSQSRADGVVNGASFVAGKNGNAISFRDTDTCEVEKSVLSLNSNEFSIMAWVQTIDAEMNGPKHLIWVLNFDGVDNYEQVSIEASPGSWMSLALVRNGAKFDFYVSSQLIASVEHSGTLVGVSLNQDYYGGEYGRGMLDDVKVYNVALTQADIIDELTTAKQQAYLIDGVDIREYGVFVSASDGILNRPKMKSPASVSWDNYHGESVDLAHKFYESREITLSCFVKAESKMDFIKQVSEFEQVFDKRGTNRLVLDVHPIKPLIYEVYCKDEIAISKTWNDNLMVGTFKLKLVEPEPVKLVLKHIRISEATKACNITMTSTKYVNIYWGDGSVDYDISGKNITVSHNYADNGDYFPVITGCIDEISNFDTNAIVVWEKI